METRKRLLERQTVVEFGVQEPPPEDGVVALASFEYAELTAPLRARTRNVPLWPALNPVTLICVELAVAAPMSTNDAPLFCSMRNSVSLFELSCQFRRITDDEVAVAVRFDGAAGALGEPPLTMV